MCVFCYATTALIAIPVALPIFIYKKIKKHRTNKVQNKTKIDNSKNIKAENSQTNEKTS